MKTRYTISAAMLLAVFTAASAQTGTTYMNVQVGEGEYKSFEVTPDLKVTWDSEATVTAPTVTNSAATNVHLTSATLNGTVTGNGEIIECGFYWGTTESPSNKIASLPGSTLSATVNGLNSGTTYYYKAYARNSAGETVASACQSFTTTGTRLTQKSALGTIGYIDGREAMIIRLPNLKKGTKYHGEWTADKDYPIEWVAIATCNVGGNRPEDAGTWFTATEAISQANSSAWGAGWRLPTAIELRQLTTVDDYCKFDDWSKCFEWVINGESCSVLRARAAGYISDGTNKSANSRCYWWTSTEAGTNGGGETLHHDFYVELNTDLSTYSEVRSDRSVNSLKVRPFHDLPAE